MNRDRAVAAVAAAVNTIPVSPDSGIDLLLADLGVHPGDVMALSQNPAGREDLAAVLRRACAISVDEARARGCSEAVIAKIVAMRDGGGAS
jgi:hypothetical protein